MEFRVTTHTADLDDARIDEINSLYELSGMGKKEPKLLRDAIDNSYRVALVYHGSTVCGIGRMISDGVYYAGIFDVAVLPSYQKKGVGRLVMETLLEAAPDMCVHLTSTFGNEGFYAHLGFKRHKTGMAKYPPRLADSPYITPWEG